MKKSLILLLAILPLTFISCSSDDEDTPKIVSPIVGTWKSGNTYITEILYLNSDGKCKSISTFMGESYEDNGTYTITGETTSGNITTGLLTIYWDYYETEEDLVEMDYVISASDNTMTTAMRGETGTATWTRQ